MTVRVEAQMGTPAQEAPLAIGESFVEPIMASVLFWGVVGQDFILFWHRAFCDSPADLKLF
jgi:hypothetical protein